MPHFPEEGPPAALVLGDRGGTPAAPHLYRPPHGPCGLELRGGVSHLLHKPQLRALLRRNRRETVTNVSEYAGEMKLLGVKYVKNKLTVLGAP